jgi:hypothetical protein
MSESLPDRAVEAPLPDGGVDAATPDGGVDASMPDRGVDASMPDRAAGEDAEELGEEPPELEIELLEYDETIPPRPEEEVADVGRATPDPH